MKQKELIKLLEANGFEWVRNGGEIMVRVYPIYLENEDDGSYIVDIPDFHNATVGRDLADALFMARDAIGLIGSTYLDEGRNLPIPDSVKYEGSGTKALIDIDIEAYMLRHDNRKVRKNCTISYALNEKAEQLGINFSQTLQEALMEKIALMQS